VQQAYGDKPVVRGWPALFGLEMADTAGSDDTHAPEPKQLKRSKPMKRSKSPGNDKVGGARMTGK
jgi:hypothetical protein